eukprot:NP_494224.1 Uncharacterized protein CELE_K09F6.5 [Caenorhabditis elegans]
MIGRMDPKSHDVIVDDLDFSTMPGTQTCIQNSRWTVVNLKNAFQAEGPWEFVLGNSSRSYLNLKRTYLVYTFNITDQNGAIVNIPNPITKDSLVYAPINNIAHSIVKNFSLHINSRLAYHNSSNYAYKAYFENALMYGKEIKNSTLTAAGYFHEDEIGSPTSKGFLNRCGTGTTQVAANISLDLMNQPRVLLNSCNVKLTAYPNNSEFLIEAYNHGQQKFKFNVTDVYALVNEFDLTDGLSNELEAAIIEHKMIQYPMISSQVRSCYIDGGRFDAPANTLFTSKMPRRLFLGLVSSEAYNGSFGTTPFNFKPYGVQDVHIDYCGQTIPGRPMNLDFENNKSKGYTIFGFELSPVAQDNNLFELVRQTNVSVRLNFKKETPPGGLYCIVYAEFDQIFALDFMRNPIVDSIV